MNVDQPSAGSVSTRNEVNAKAAKTTTKNQSRGRSERGRGAMLGANSTAKAKMLFGLAFESSMRRRSSRATPAYWRKSLSTYGADMSCVCHTGSKKARQKPL